MADFELRADFDHDGRLTGSQTEYDARQAAPGAILVANADADRRAFPTSVTAGPAIALDFTRYTPSAADDEILPLSVSVNNPAAAASRTFGVRVPGIHGVRVRFYDSTGTILRVTDSSTPGEHPLPALTAPQLDLQVETRSYPGSPYGHATLFSLTFDPDEDYEDESGFVLELFSRDAQQQHEQIHDVGNFSVAPILLLDNGMTAVRVYMSDKPENAASLTDVREALRAIGGVTLVTVDGSITEDTWLQDQFQPGIVVGADTWRHVIVHLPRVRSDSSGRQATQNLAAFVTSHFPAHDIGLMDDFWARTISFSDTSNATRSVSFADCAALATQMAQVFFTIDYLDHIAAQADRTSVAHGGWTWPEARTRLRPLLDEVSGKVDAAESSISAEAFRTLKSQLDDARNRVGHLEGAFPVGAGGAAVTLPSGGTSFEVPADTARDLFLRAEQLQDSANYGGNIEGSPPTPDAPLGKIVIGNARRFGVVDHMDPDVQRLVKKQRQPVVEVDTTFLDVGHVDEVLTLVPDRGGTTQTFAALRASSGLAMNIVRAALAQYRSGLPENHPQQSLNHPSGVIERLTNAGISPVTRLMRGKVWPQIHPAPSANTIVADINDPPRMYQDLASALNGGDPAFASTNPYNIHDIHYLPGEGPPRAYPADITVLELVYTDLDNGSRSVNNFVESTFLTPIDGIVAREFRGARIFPLPVVFDRVANITDWQQNRWSFRTSAYTPDLVNLQVVNGHVLVPRPYGPRMRPADATAVLTEVLQPYSWGQQLVSQLTSSFYRRTGLDSTICWVHRQDTIFQTTSSIGTVRRLYDGITSLTDVANCFKDGFAGQSDQQVRGRILRDNGRNFDPAGTLRDDWRRFVIHEDMVDLFEAYTQLVVSALGLTLHFVDSWFYHVNFGGIHCGTNVIREPQRGQLPRWWLTPAPTLR